MQKEKTPTSPTPAFAASAGTHTPMHGEAMKFSAAGLGQMVSGTDTAKHSAPIVFGQPQTDAPAHGWIGKLSVNKGTLFATPSEVSPSLADKTREGAAKCRQSSFTLHPPTIPAMASGSIWQVAACGLFRCHRQSLPKRAREAKCV